MKDSGALDHFLFHAPEGALDRYQALLEEDQALRHAEYDKPDPKRRRLKVMCNECETPWCCNQRVAVDFVEALVIYRYAVEHAPRELSAAVARGKSLHQAPPLADKEFFEKRRACPLLLRGQCMVFPVRPHRCRTHYMAGNPQKCRNELAPSETYEMSPDKSILIELEKIAEEVRFDALIDSVRPVELSEVLYFIDCMARSGKGPWRAMRTLDWDMIE